MKKKLSNLGQIFYDNCVFFCSSIQLSYSVLFFCYITVLNDKEGRGYEKSTTSFKDSTELHTHVQHGMWP